MKSYRVEFPPRNEHFLEQNEEYFTLHQNGHSLTFKLHEYHKVYKFPRLYEYVIVDLLKETSHEYLPELLIAEAGKCGVASSDLIVLDIGAGTGLIGEGLKKRGVNRIMGVDLLIEAAEAVKRDRPGVYRNYYVENLCQLSHQARHEIEASLFNCLICGSAASYHIPPSAFANAYNMLTEKGWVVVNLREHLPEECKRAGAGLLIERVIEDGTLEILFKQPYLHRITVYGTPITYIAIVGRKRSGIPQKMIS